MGQITWLEPDSINFPDTSLALDDPNGLLAAGGDLSCERLLAAYAQGIFPWFSDNQPVLWWTPSPRLVLFPEKLQINRSTRKFANKRPFTFSVDTAFNKVIYECAHVQRNGEGTWITDEVRTAYCKLHEQGKAHSVEAWQNGKLVGGLYGIALGKVFFGESMFSLVSGASRLAFITLCLQLKAWDFQLIDCQVETDYLLSFGAEEINREEFEGLLQIHTKANSVKWQQAWTMPDYGL